MLYIPVSCTLYVVIALSAFSLSKFLRSRLSFDSDSSVAPTQRQLR